VPVACLGAHVDPTGTRVVGQGVVDQVGDEAFDEARVTTHLDRREVSVQLDRTAPRLGLVREKDLLDERREVERLALGEACPASGEREERLD